VSVYTKCIFLFYLNSCNTVQKSFENIPIKMFWNSPQWAGELVRGLWV